MQPFTRSDSGHYHTQLCHKTQMSSVFKKLIACACLCHMLLFPALSLAELPAEERTVSDRVNELLKLRKYSEATSLLKTELSKDPDKTDLRLRLMDLYLLSGKHYDAELLAAQGQNHCQSQSECLQLEIEAAVGPVLAQDENPQPKNTMRRIDELIKTAHQIAPNQKTPELNYLNGIKAKMEGNADDAEQGLLQALAQNPNWYAAKRDLVDVYASKQAITLAVPFMKQMLEHDPDDPDIQYVLAKLFDTKGDKQKAIEHYEKVATMAPGIHPMLILRRAISEREIGKTDEAIKDYETVLDIWPERADIWFQVGELYDAKSQDYEAISAYQRAYKLDPETLIPFLQHAEKTFWTDSIYKSADEYRKLVRIAPDRDDIVGILSAIYYRMSVEGGTPLPSLVEEADQWAFHLEPTAIQPIIYAELQRVQSGSDTPGLIQQTATLSKQAPTPYIKALYALLLKDPVAAQNAMDEINIAQLTSLDFQHLVLLGGGRYVNQVVLTNDELVSYRPWLKQWEATQSQKALDYIMQAKQFNSVQNATAALAAVDKARLYDPFAAEIYLEKAKAEMLLKNPVEARKTLQAAQNLGLTKSQLDQSREILEF